MKQRTMERSEQELEECLYEMCLWLKRILPSGYQARVMQTPKENLERFRNSLGHMLKGSCLQDGRQLPDLFLRLDIVNLDEMAHIVIERFHDYLLNEL